MDELDLLPSPYPYRVVTSLTHDEIQDLSDRLDADATKILAPIIVDPSPMFWAKTVEFGLKHSSVLLPIAGAVGKSALDVLVDIAKKWLATRPDDRTITIYGPDYQVVRVVKTGEAIQTSSEKLDPKE